MTEKKDDPRDEMEHTLARFARENDTLRRADKKHYERARRLENAIRRHSTGECSCRNPKECIFNLGKLVTKRPRLSYKAKRLAAYKS